LPTGSPSSSSGQVDRVPPAAQVDVVDVAEERERLRDVELLGSRHEAAEVLGQAAAAEAQPRTEEAPADARVVPDRVGQSHDVGTGGLAQLGHRVDERDLGGEERVGRALDQLAVARSVTSHGVPRSRIGA
jgi:hypothetical protein